MFCRKCGGKLQPEDSFCDSCGSAASTLSRPAPRPVKPAKDAGVAVTRIRGLKKSSIPIAIVGAFALVVLDLYRNNWEFGERVGVLIIFLWPVTAIVRAIGRRNYRKDQ
jgi:uncharacterized membrane protein YvbJ